MPDMDPSHSASTGASKESAPKLDPLFAEWAAVEAAEPPPLAPDDRLAVLRRLKRGLDIRVTITVVLVLMAVILMWRTRHGVAYWLQSSDPVELGDLRARWVKGDRILPAASELHDTWVHVAGLVPTRLIGVSPDPDAASADSLAYVFYCPLYDLTVLSQQKVVVGAAGTTEFDPNLRALVLRGLAEPADTMARWDGNGRLLRGNAAPSELRDVVESYARRMGKLPSETWVLIEGKSPGSYGTTVLLWAFSLVPIIVSLVFLVRARRAWERAVATGDPA